MDSSPTSSENPVSSHRRRSRRDKAGISPSTFLTGKIIPQFSASMCITCIVPYSITSVGLGGDSGFLDPQMSFSHKPGGNIGCR